MKIYNNPNVNKVMRKYQKNVEKTNKTNKANFKEDKLEISSSAREFQLAMSAAKKLPEVRQEKIDAVKKEMANGKYNPTANEIAKKMLNNSNLVK
jgi:negative regulator of flagellin synthesis FlgM